MRGAAEQRQHHGDRGIGDVGGAVIGRVADGDAARTAPRAVDVVEADPAAHDDPPNWAPAPARRRDRELVIEDDPIAAPPRRLGHLARMVRALDVDDGARPRRFALDIRLARELGVGMRMRRPKLPPEKVGLPPIRGLRPEPPLLPENVPKRRGEIVRTRRRGSRRGPRTQAGADCGAAPRERTAMPDSVNYRRSSSLDLGSWILGGDAISTTTVLTAGAGHGPGMAA